jgi:hypothetical protein
MLFAENGALFAERKQKGEKKIFARQNKGKVGAGKKASSFNESLPCKKGKPNLVNPWLAMKPGELVPFLRKLCQI